jgi:hypothetical protein
MTEQILTRSRTDTSLHCLRRHGETAARRTDGAGMDDAAAAGRRQDACAARGSERLRRCGLSVQRWRDVATAWVMMVVLTAALIGWLDLRLAPEAPQVQNSRHHIRGLSGPAPAGTCSERDYANERC